MTINTLQDYGPLQLLIGQWKGNTGDDRSPEPDGTEINEYRETITFDPIREVSNAEEQNLAVLQYRQIVHRIKDNKQIHDQCGYWIWDAHQDTIMHSFCIPRGLSVLAGGKSTIKDKQVTLKVAANINDSEWTIQQAPFLNQKAKTIAFVQTLTVKGDSLSYDQTTSLDIYGRFFKHTDINTLTRQT